MTEYVVLVDEQDHQVGVGEKSQVHAAGTLHRAFSVFVFNQEGHLLLQQRNPAKYHSGGLWSNTCCGHPRPGEVLEAAARRRLHEEMGFSCVLRRSFGFVYHTRLADELYEHEYDHVFVGRYDDDPVPAEEEVSAWQWIAPVVLRQDVAERPECYTYWFRLILNRVLDVQVLAA